MVHAASAVIIIAFILCLSEILWRKAHIKGEFARKFVHIIAGCFIAFLPFWLSYGWIELLSVGFIVANILNRYTPLFHAIHAITRKSWGDLFFGVGILLAASVRPNKWIFAAAILQVALADGLAAIVGSHYGKHKYKLFDHYKSPIGTLTFMVTSFFVTLIVLVLSNFHLQHSQVLVLTIIPLAMTILENISGYGTDNVVLPVGYLVLLYLFKV